MESLIVCNSEKKKEIEKQIPEAAIIVYECLGDNVCFLVDKSALNEFLLLNGTTYSHKGAS